MFYFTTKSIKMQADLKKALGLLLKCAISPLVQGNRCCSSVYKHSKIS